MKKPARKVLSNSPKTSSPVQRGQLVRVLTPDELHEDMKDFVDHLVKDKKATVAFLQAAGIFNRHGKLAKGYRS